MQYNKAGINVTLKSAGGSPFSGVTINGITKNYDGTGTCVTDSEGKCFGYCDTGQVIVSTDNFADFTSVSEQLNTLSSEMYEINLIISNFISFVKYTGTTNIKFSNNGEKVDVTCVGGGGGASGGLGVFTVGGGGYC